MYKSAIKALVSVLVIQSGFISSVTNADENASSPLAKVRNTDAKARYFDIDGSDRMDYAVEGALMLSPKLKFRYEARYWETDVTGKDRSGMEAVRAKGIYFPAEGAWGDTPYRLAVGGEIKLNFDNQDRGIGQDADTFLPFFGAAFSLRPGTTVIPLLQHEIDFDGVDVSATSFRLLALQTLPNNSWLKLDSFLSIDWENDQDTPSFAELQWGRQLTPTFGIYAEGMVGFGGYKPYDWGLGLGLRFLY